MLLSKLGTALAVTALASAMSVSAVAAEWPGSKPISMIIPYAAGGFADTRMRMLGEELAKELKANVVIENKAGAGGVIGTAEVARAKPDGYTIGSGHLAPLSVNPTLMPKNVPYNVQKDLVPVILIEEAPLILSVNKKVPVSNVSELIALAKKDPGRITFGSSGVGGAHHLSGELFANNAGVQMTHVPYKGGAPAATDLMAGHIDMMFEMGYAAMPAIQADKVKPLAVTSSTRLPLLPEVPTVAEAGLPGFESYNWQGIVVPTGTPTEIVEKLNTAFNKILKKPEVIKAFEQTGGVVGGGTPEEFGKFIEDERVKWAEVIKEAKISVD